MLCFHNVLHVCDGSCRGSSVTPIGSRETIGRGGEWTSRRARTNHVPECAQPDHGHTSARARNGY
jgi:hypothetical protein